MGKAHGEALDSLVRHHYPYSKIDEHVHLRASYTMFRHTRTIPDLVVSEHPSISYFGVEKKGTSVSSKSQIGDRRNPSNLA